MKKCFIFVLLLAVACLQPVSLLGQHIFTAGPTLHLNIGGGKNQLSYGLEVAYWNVFGLPYGMDAGIEVEKSSLRVYTEAQTGLIFGGLSAGPYLEFLKDSPLKGGLQTSAWVNAFAGLNMRARFTKGPDTFSPGIYAKYIWTPGGGLYEKFRENHEEDNDWDWD